MRLRSIILKDVRRFTDPVRIDGIGDGVNVLCAPNEFGKSTVFDALRALFFVPHSSRSREIAQIRPHAGGAPEVSVELETPEGMFVVSKRWFSRPEARVTRGGLLIAQADEAEAWISRLLGGGDGGPSGLLWVRQGVTGLSDGSTREQQAALDARRDLLSSITGEVEAMTGGRRMDAALARCEAELGIFATATGRPRAGGPWATAQQNVERLTEERIELAASVARLQAALDERSRHRRELAALETPDATAERKARLDTARAAFEAAKAHAVKVSVAEQALRSATLEAQRAQGELERLRAAVAAKAAAVASDAEARETLARAADALAKAEATLAEAVAAHDAADEGRRQAEALLRRAQARDAAATARERRVELGDRLTLADAARQKVESANATASVGPDDRDMDRLRTLSAALATARALRDSTSTRVTMRYAAGREDGVRHAEGALAPDATLNIHGDTVLYLEGIGELTVHPGEGPEGVADVAEAEAELARALSALGASSIEEVTRAHRKRKDAAILLAQVQAEFSALAPKGIDELRRQLAALPDTPEEDGRDLPSVEEAQSALHATSGRVLELRARQDAARERRDEARTDHTRAVVRQEEAADRLSASVAALEQLAHAEEADLAARAAAAEEQRQRAEDALAGARSTAPDIAGAEAALARAQSIEEAARKRINELRPAIATLDERVAGSAGEAVEERLMETEERLAAAQARLTGIAREVKILERLRAALEAARSEARDRYFEPVAEELRPLLHLLWPDAELDWADETLLPQSLVRNGQVEEVGILSGGTQEQIALLVRLAFARLLAKDGRHAPVILDDALVFTDDDRIEAMFDALHRMAGDLQIIVLSCRQRAFRDLGGRALQVTAGERA